MADYLEAYATQFDLPIQLDTRVESLTRDGDRYALEAGLQRFRANQVVVATGRFTTRTPPGSPENLPHRSPSCIPASTAIPISCPTATFSSSGLATREPKSPWSWLALTDVSGYPGGIPVTSRSVFSTVGSSGGWPIAC